MKNRPNNIPRSGAGPDSSQPVEKVVSPSATGIRLLIVDDHAVVRAGMAAMLSIAPGIDQVAMAADGTEVIQICDTFDPHVILLDLRMPGLDGHSALEAIIARWPQRRVVILTGSDKQADVKLAKRHGAAGFLNKSADPITVLNVIKLVAAGGTHFPAVRENEDSESTHLSPRELEVLRHLVRGFTNEEIGRVLGVSGETIKSHLKHVFPKLNAATRAEAASRAHELGFV